MRNSRKKTLDEVKKLKGSISEDESKRFTKEVRSSPLLVSSWRLKVMFVRFSLLFHVQQVETVTEKSLEKVSKLVSDKEKEIQNS